MHFIGSRQFLKHVYTVGVVTLCTYIPSSHSVNIAATEAALNSTLSYLENQQLGDGSWGENDNRYIATASIVEALQASNNLGPAYYDGIAWLENHASNNVDYTARKILTLSQSDYPATLEKKYLDNARKTGASGLGLSEHYVEDTIDSAFALRASVSSNDTSNLAQLRAYLISSRLANSGWSLGNETTANIWATAEALIALNTLNDASLNTAKADAVAFLSSISISASDDDTVLLARAALAVYQYAGLTANVDAWVSELLTRQSANGWQDSYTTALVLRTFSAVLGLDNPDNFERVSVRDQTLRTIINLQLGKNAFDNLNRGEVSKLTMLDLMGAGVKDLTGLEYAANLTELIVEGNVDTSLIEGIAGLNLVRHSDTDNLADANDNCPLIDNADQANLDGDQYGDACDPDIDGDGMPNTWEQTYALNHLSSSDAILDPDTDLLLNVEEYNQGTNPIDPDSDGDGLADGVEFAYSVEGLSPVMGTDAAADFDQDNLSNADEIAWETGMNNPDSDSDGALDGDEVLAGRDPLLNEPALIVIINSILL